MAGSVACRGCRVILELLAFLVFRDVLDFQLVRVGRASNMNRIRRLQLDLLRHLLWMELRHIQLDGQFCSGHCAESYAID